MLGVGELWRRQPIFAFFGIFFALSVPVLFALTQLDERTVDGINVWVKPLKFSVSLGFYSLTLAFFTPWMRSGGTEGRSFKIALFLYAASMIFETAWLWSASYYGIRAHFNIDGGLYTILYPLSGVAAFFLVLVAFAMGVSALRGRKYRNDPVLTTAIGWGLILTFILTPIVAFPLSSPMADLGGSKNGYGEGLFGWRVPGGDLRAAHFFAIHAVHFIPLFGWIVSLGVPGRLGVFIVRLGAAAFAVLVLMLAFSVYQGQDLPQILRIPI